MAQWQRLSTVEQLTTYLRDELSRGDGETMPGVHRLSSDLGVNRKTVEAALRSLEGQGLLESRGPGRRRKIVRPEKLAAPTLRVAIFPYDSIRLVEGYVMELQHLLLEAGHTAFFPTKSLGELGMDVGRVARQAERTEADAWVISSGSVEVLEWFAAQPAPAFALFGRRRRLPIAGVGPHKPPAFAAATRRLLELGHRRIVLLARKARRLPTPGASERAFLDELAAHGLTPGSYNLPDWEETVEAFHGRLEALFDVTPPTALIVDEASFFFATQQFLANRGLHVPQDVSLVCTDGDPHFAWCRPTVAHIRWDPRPVMRRITRWAGNVARGKDDRRQSFTKAEFVEGGTVGVAS